MYTDFPVPHSCPSSLAADTWSWNPGADFSSSAYARGGNDGRNDGDLDGVSQETQQRQHNTNFQSFPSYISSFESIFIASVLANGFPEVCQHYKLPSLSGMQHYSIL